MPEVHSLLYSASREQLENELDARHQALKTVLTGIQYSDRKDPALDELVAIEQRVYSAVRESNVVFWVVRFEPGGARIIHEERKLPRPCKVFNEVE